IPGEFYRPSQRLKLYIMKVEDTPKGSVVMLSRAYPKLISKLFELEVPEIASGTVVIKAIAREPGFRTKIAVVSNEEQVDPIGACVGQRGTRIMAVINELGGEKIDVIEWQEKPEKFIANALAPAKIVEVEVEDKNTAVVYVPADQLSLAIGKDGRNVRLAAQLTGWKIDIKTKDVPAEGDEAESAAKEEKEEKKDEDKPKKKAKKTKAKKEKLGPDGEAVEETPAEVDDATEPASADDSSGEAKEKPADNPTEEK
ncbi:MAG: transcription termination factor NusA, partial [Candidatus Staskawiczbacteria bacterium]|nr:transcription termination factor NusA [Candidatus Staskawiczbacteria bacterium]